VRLQISTASRNASNGVLRTPPQPWDICGDSLIQREGEGMRRVVIGAVLSVVVIVVGAAPAQAESTRAEYVAQVDPICQSFVGPNDDAFRAWFKNEKLLGPVARHGTLKQFVAQTKRIASSLKRIARIEANLTNQIATVPPATEDFATVGTWLNYRRQEEAALRSAASILVQFRPYKQYSRKLNMADAADQAATRTVSGLGFQVCEVIV
jgi:hypothetical protein